MCLTYWNRVVMDLAVSTISRIYKDRYRLRCTDCAAHIVTVHIVFPAGRPACGIACPAWGRSLWTITRRYGLRMRNSSRTSHCCSGSYPAVHSESWATARGSGSWLIQNVSGNSSNVSGSSVLPGASAPSSEMTGHRTTTPGRSTVTSPSWTAPQMSSTSSKRTPSST